MNEINVKQVFKRIFSQTILYLLVYGLFVLYIAYQIFKDIIDFRIIILLIFFIFFLIALIDEIKNINIIFKSKNDLYQKKITEFKRILENRVDSLQQKIIGLEKNSEEYEIKTNNEMLKEKNLNNEKLVNIKNAYMQERKLLIEQYNKKINQLNKRNDDFKKAIEDEKIYKPYLAAILANYYEEIDSLKARMLETKKNPALKARDEINYIKKENKNLRKNLKIKEYQITVYEKMFPWLEEFKELPESEITSILNKEFAEGYDRVKEFLSPEEYEKLPDCEKYQLWLDRYRKKKNKTNWEIGVEFERFVGYMYETQGYKLIYNGAREGLEDLGRDLIALKDLELLVIQCKNWKKEKIIHEKHIFQLYGTMILKSIEEPNKNVRGIFITTTKLSEMAKKVAKRLNIEVIEEYKYDKTYPCIKCNISRKDGTKIYHLPFDQQYDRIDIEVAKGELYVGTVKEAEKLGFRKAMKHNYYE